MVIKKIRSEYMRNFKDPKWESYTRCYEDSLQFRLSRRLLEQSHRPWFWEDSDTESSGQSTPHIKADTLQVESAEQGSGDIQDRAVSDAKAAPHKDPQPEISAQEETRPEDARETVGGEDERKENDNKQMHQGAARPIHTKKSARTKSQTRQPKEVNKENRHPFVLYGSGEKQVETANKRTHNVLPRPSTKEIHASALLAKTRREVGKQLKTQTCRRAQSVDLVKMIKVPPLIQTPEYNPWMTEYMRCF